jgi:leucyl aminopeptidase (aminopeptidase T)
MLDQTTEMRVTAPNGTDFHGVIEGRPVQYETGLFREPGQFAALPNSEINISPIEGTAEGVAVIDVRVMSVGITRREPLTLHMKDGLIESIQGGGLAEDLERILADFQDPSAYNVAEFGIGLNPVARECATNLEDLGKSDHAHIGIGSNYAIGGSVKAPCHIDAILREASVYLDGKLVYDKGNLVE